jgi:hypothetical protein
MLPRHRLSEEPSPLSDAEATAQVVEAARQMVRTAGLVDVTGAFSFESCNDQGEPPYRGRVDMSFAAPAGVEPEAFFVQVAATMVAQGWHEGPPAGKRPFGVVVHTDTVMAVIGRACGDGSRGSVQLCGQCRNMTDHRTDGKTVGTDVTGQLGGN